MVAEFRPQWNEGRRSRFRAVEGDDPPRVYIDVDVDGFGWICGGEYTYWGAREMYEALGAVLAGLGEDVV